jgi:maltose alpha-D-glucosyltransferase/alpha-amylase
LIIKFYKRPDEGLNPEEEALIYLQENTGFNHILSFSGSLKYLRTGSESYTPGIISEYKRFESDAWKFFSDSLDNYFDRISVKEKKEVHFINSLFDMNFNLSLFEEFVDQMTIGMSALLGEITAQMHMALSSAEDTTIKAEPVTIFYQRSIYQSMRSHIKSTFRLLKNKSTSDSKSLIPEIINYEQKLISFIDRILKIKFSAKKIRIHGNYNLKQILFTGKDFIITNFEGQPGIPYTERKLKRSPLRDAASLIFSLHTVAYHKLTKQNIFPQEEINKTENYVIQWWLSISRIFISKYFKTFSENKNPVIQAEIFDLNYLLLVYLLEKVLVDLSYGINSNADWVNIKLKALAQLFSHIDQLEKTAGPT